jgi:predicted ATPase
MEKLVELTGRERLVTLSGVGGCGKTRLALRVAQQVGLGRPDGTCFVELVSVRDAEMVGQAVASSLTLPLDADRSASQQVCQSLANKGMLLVLDNCEHLLDAAASFAEVILDSCPSVTVLTTSREPLGVEGEHVFRVGSFELPGPGDDPVATEAVKFFAERASAARASFELGNHVDAISEICHRLDGMPLALELAAARVRYESPEEIAAQLDHRFRLLAGGPRRLARQQTLRATMDWSYALLTPTEQEAFKRLGVFVGSFTREAFEGVCVDDHLNRDVLDSLIDKSLVEVVETGNGLTRFRVLETVRIYAVEKMTDAGELANARRRHREFYVELSRSWEPPHGDRFFSVDIAAPEADNLTAALFDADEAGDPEALCYLVETLGPAWMLLTRQEEDRRWIERARSEDTGLSLPRRTGWRAASIALDWAAAEMGVGLADAVEALRLDPRGETYGALVATFFRAGMMAYFDWKECLQILDEVRAMPAIAQRPDMEVAITYGKAVAHLIGGSFEEAEHFLRTALFEHSAAGDSLMVVWDRLSLATTLYLLGRHDESITEARSAADGVAQDALYMQDLVAPTIVGVALTGTGDITGAREQLQRALEVHDRRYAHMPRVAGVPVTVAVSIELAVGRLEEAAVLIAATEGQFANYRTEVTFTLLNAYHHLAKAALAEHWTEARGRGRLWDLDRLMSEIRKVATRG